MRLQFVEPLQRGVPARVRLSAARLPAPAPPRGAARDSACLLPPPRHPTIAARAAPLLRDVFRAAEAPAELGQLARALVLDPAASVPLPRLLDGAPDLRHHPAPWRALLAAGHAEAVRQLLGCLRDPAATPRELATALRVWREAATVLSPACVERLPALLQKALAD